ncbi:MAG: thiamine pyrophosphate-binding protein [Proteobacteria bacterium]|nr:thiamine pyrophosphate-binding protein [Pseudomonadota bacterium]
MSGWAEDVFDVLVSAEIRQAAYVPDMGLKKLIEMCIADDAMTAVSLTTEEEGLALLGGAWMGGDRGVLMMQSSGVGNCINMLSLTRSCEFPLLMIVTMRGQDQEFNSWQRPMGQNAQEILGLAGVCARMIEETDAVAPAVASAAEEVFATNARIAVMVHQKLMPIKTFGK